MTEKGGRKKIKQKKGRGTERGGPRAGERVGPRAPVGTCARGAGMAPRPWRLSCSWQLETRVDPPSDMQGAGAAEAKAENWAGQLVGRHPDIQDHGC